MPRPVTSSSAVVLTTALQAQSFGCSSEEVSHEVELHRAGKMLCDVRTLQALDHEAEKRLHGKRSLPFEG
jgi:hypothetical protein